MLEMKTEWRPHVAVRLAIAVRSAAILPCIILPSKSPLVSQFRVNGCDRVQPTQPTSQTTNRMAAYRFGTVTRRRTDAQTCMALLLRYCV